MKIIFFFIIILIFSILISYSHSDIYVDPITPTYDDIVKQIEKLQYNSEVIRNSVDIPKIKAKTERDANFVTGFTHAQLGTASLEYVNRVVNNNMAALIGFPGVGIDYLSFVMGFGRLGKKNWNLFKNETDPRMIKYKENIMAYVDGINLFYDRYYEKLKLLPTAQRLAFPSFSKWEYHDVFSVQNFLAFALGQDINQIRANILAEYGVDFELIRDLFKGFYKRFSIPLDYLGMTQEEADLLIKEYNSDSLAYVPGQNINTMNRKLNNNDNNKNSNKKINKKIINKNIKPEYKEDYEHFESKNKEIRKTTKLFKSSNGICISGEYTKSGNSETAGGPDLENFLGGLLKYLEICYEDEDNNNKTFCTYGSGYLGTTGPQFGGNTNGITFTITNPRLRNFFFYKVKEDDNGMSYWFKGQKHPYEIKYTTIQIRDTTKQNYTTFPYILAYKDTKYGPEVSAIYGTGNIKIIMQYGSRDIAETEKDYSIFGLYLLTHKSKTLDDVEEALTYIKSSLLNIMWSGNGKHNFGEFITGATPMPVKGITGRFFLDFNDTNSIVPNNYIPRSLLNFRGDKKYISSITHKEEYPKYFANANNKIIPMNLENFLHYNNRQYRMCEYIDYLINKKIKITGKHLEKLLIDVKSSMFVDYLPELNKIENLILETRDENIIQWFYRLKAWDQNFDLDTKEGTIFQYWRSSLFDVFPHNTNSIIIGEKMAYIIKYLKEDSSFCGNCTLHAAENFIKTIRDFYSMYNNTIPKWGEVHTSLFDSIFLGNTELRPNVTRVIPTPGSTSTIRYGGDKGIPRIINNKYVQQTYIGANVRHVITHKGNKIKVKYMINTGNGGEFTQPSFDDHINKFVKGEYNELDLYHDVDVQHRMILLKDIV